VASSVIDSGYASSLNDYAARFVRLEFRLRLESRLQADKTSPTRVNAVLRTELRTCHTTATLSPRTPIRGDLRISRPHTSSRRWPQSGTPSAQRACPPSPGAHSGLWLVTYRLSLPELSCLPFRRPAPIMAFETGGQYESRVGRTKCEMCRCDAFSDGTLKT
jgi:hypothetical protein